jgi:hypothetical protein
VFSREVLDIEDSPGSVDSLNVLNNLL